MLRDGISVFSGEEKDFEVECPAVRFAERENLTGGFPAEHLDPALGVGVPEARRKRQQAHIHLRRQFPEEGVSGVPVFRKDTGADQHIRAGSGVHALRHP